MAGRKEETLRKYNTIIFIPHAKAPFRKISVSSRFLRVTAAAAAAILLAAIAFGWAYFASSRRDHQYKRALAENARLKTKTFRLNQRLEGLARRLTEFEDRTRRLAIVAGLPPAGPSGVGGPLTDRERSPFADRSALLDAHLGDVERQFAKRVAVISSTPTVAPVLGVVNSGFGTRRDPFNGSAAFHAGLDISTVRHEPALATAEGVVVKSGWSGDYGKMVEIAHRSGYHTVYGHLDRVLVGDGQRVSRGDRIGLVGSTGRSTGTHLHYEVRRGDRPVNPLEYILDAR